MDLVGRDVHAGFSHSVNGHTIDAQFGGDTGKVEAANRGDADLKPSRLAGSRGGFVCADKGFPSGLERAGQVRGEAKCAAGVFQACNITFVTVPAFYPILLMVSHKVSISFHPIRMPRPRGGIISFHPLCVAPGRTSRNLRF